VGAEQQLVEAGAANAGGWICRRLAGEAGGRGRRGGEESRTWRRGGRLAEASRAPPQAAAVAPSRQVLCLSSSLLSVGGGADDLGVESTDPEKPLEEHDFNNFLNCPYVGDIPNRYTSDVVLNQQARVAH
jgi:hypothetical protein